MLKKSSKAFALFLILAILTGTGAHAAEVPTLNAPYYVLYEKTTGSVLLQSPNINIKEVNVYPASMTKILTGILAIEMGDMSSTVTVSGTAIAGLFDRGSIVNLKEGEEIPFRVLVEYLLIGSGNDAANVLAEEIAGSIPAFIDLMNRKAEEIGCTGTNFTNAHGLHEDDHYTTVWDMLLISMYAMENAEFAEIVSKDNVVLPVTNMRTTEEKKWTTNFLLSANAASIYKYDGAAGIKTGHTSKAGNCLSSSYTYDNLEFYTVVMGAEKIDDVVHSFTDTIKLFDYGKSNFSIKPLLRTTEAVSEMTVTLSANTDTLPLMPQESITALLPENFSYDEVTLTPHHEESVAAPVTKGDVLGTVSVTYNGKSYGDVPLIASISVERSSVLYAMDRIKGFFSSTFFKVFIVILIILVILFIVYMILLNRRRRLRRMRRRQAAARRRRR